jgi:glycosyltransferase involved in cell wall biosynthesis
MAALMSCSTWSAADMALPHSTDLLPPRRLAIITDFLGQLAGTERYTVTVASALASVGTAVEVYVAERPGHPTWIELLRSRDVAVHLPVANGPRDELWRRLDDRIACGAFDLVLANPMGEALVRWLALSPETLRLPPLVGVEYTLPSPRSAHWYPRELRRVIHRLDAVLATCQASAHAVADYFGYQGPIHVVPHIIVPPHCSRAPELPRHHLGIVSRLSIEKGLDYALAAVALLAHAGTRVELSIYGTGIDKDRLGELAACLDVGELVHLCGTFHPTLEIDEVLQRHAIWLQPSLFESIPTALLELASRRRVVITTAVGGIPEVLNGVPGAEALMLTPGDTRALADRMRDVLENEVRYERLAAGLQRHVLSMYATDVVLPRMLEVLRQYAAP